jgi:hypothetical protein
MAGHPFTSDPQVLPLLGPMIGLIPVGVTGGLTFRTLSSPRAVLLIPRGRLQLLLGALVAQLLMASCVALLTGTSHYLAAQAAVEPWSAMEPIELFVGVFGFLSMMTLGMFMGGAGGAAWLAVLGVYASPAWLPRLGPWLAHTWWTGHVGWLATSACAEVAGWTGFGLWYLHARRIEPWRPGQRGGGRQRGGALGASGAWSGGIVGLIADPTVKAVRTLLLGPRPYAQLSRSMAIVCLMLLLFSIVPGLARADGEAMHVLRAFICAWPATCAAGGLLAVGIRNRTRGLWLREGFERNSLYRLAERYAWEQLVLLFAVVAGISLLAQTSWPSLAAAGTRALLTDGAAGVSFLYLALFLTERWRATNVAATVIVAALWLVGIQLAWDEAAWPPLCLLVLLQLFAAALLRWQGKRQWTHIDWLTNKPVRWPTGARTTAR